MEVVSNNTESVSKKKGKKKSKKGIGASITPDYRDKQGTTIISGEILPFLCNLDRWRYLICIGIGKVSDEM